MLANLINKNTFSALGDAEEKSGATVSTAAQFNNPESGHGGVPTKKTLFGQFHSAETGLNQTGNDLYRVLGQMQYVKTKVKLIEYLPGKLRSILNTVRFIRARLSPISSSSQLSYAGGKRFLLFSTFPSFNNTF